MSPRVRPDIRPAKQTSPTHMTKYTQNMVSQHGTSFAAIVSANYDQSRNRVLIDRIATKAICFIFFCLFLLWTKFKISVIRLKKGDNGLIATTTAKSC